MVRVYAAFTLAGAGSSAKTAVRALIEALKDKDGDVVVAAAIALGNIGHDAIAAIPALMLIF